MMATFVGGGCSLLLEPITFAGEDAGNDGGSPRDAGADARAPTDAGERDAGPACASDGECPGVDETCESGVCLSCDADGDSFFDPRPSCDAARGTAEPDCDDTMSAVYPGAPPICGDGHVNGCEAPPAMIAAALDVQEIGVVRAVPIHRTEAGVAVQSLSLGAISSSGGEANAAAAIFLFPGALRAAVLPFDHQDIREAAPLPPEPTARAWESIRSVDVWSSEDTSSITVAVNASVREGSSHHVPFFGDLSPGFASVAVSPAEPDRGRCPYTTLARHAYSAQRDALVYVGATAGGTYSLHATTASGTLRCVPDLSAAGFPVDDLVGVVAAGDFAILTSVVGGFDIRTWHLSGAGAPRAFSTPLLGEAPFIRLGASDLYSVIFEDADVLRALTYECLPTTGCSEVGESMVPANGFLARAAAWWGDLSAVSGFFEGRLVDGDETEGVEIILQHGEDSLRLPVLSQIAGPGAVGFSANAVAVVPPVAGAPSTDLLVGMALQHPDTSSSIDVAVVRGCFAR